jgi:hypothetical protein
VELDRELNIPLSLRSVDPAHHSGTERKGRRASRKIENRVIEQIYEFSSEFQTFALADTKILVQT